MYPTLYDLLLDLFGISIPPFKLVQSFGMMVALAFLAASIDLKSELKRKEKQGLLEGIRKRVMTEAKSNLFQKLTSALIGFVIGFKFLPLITEFDSIVGNPQAYILSAEGSLLGGLLGAAISVGIRIWDDRKLPAESMEIEVLVHPYEHVGTITIYAAIFGIGGAKIFHNLENLDELMADPIGALISFSGLSFLGGVICATIAILWYAKKNNIRLLHLTDAALPGLMLAYGIGRMGCQIAGDGDWGIPNDAPKPEWLSWLPDWAWAYDYPNNVLGIDLKQDFAQMGYVSLTGHAWPTPIYETTMALIIFGFLWYMRKRWTVPGMVAAWYLVLGGVERFAIESIRINNEYPIFGGVTQAEIISVVMIITGIAFLFIMPKYGHKWAEY
jgi:prolipoprotein diacylglyceryltransferase